MSHLLLLAELLAGRVRLRSARHRILALIGAARGEFLDGTPDEVRGALRDAARWNFVPAFLLFWWEGRLADRFSRGLQPAANQWAIADSFEGVSRDGLIPLYESSLGGQSEEEQDLILFLNYLRAAGSEMEGFLQLARARVLAAAYSAVATRIRETQGLNPEAVERELSRLRAEGMGNLVGRTVDEVFECVAARCRIPVYDRAKLEAAVGAFELPAEMAGELVASLLESGEAPPKFWKRAGAVLGMRCWNLHAAIAAAEIRPS